MLVFGRPEQTGDSANQPSDRLGTCPGCTPPASAPLRNPELDKQNRMDGWILNDLQALCH